MKPLMHVAAPCSPTVSPVPLTPQLCPTSPLTHRPTPPSSPARKRKAKTGGGGGATAGRESKGSRAGGGSGRGRKGGERGVHRPAAGSGARSRWG